MKVGILSMQRVYNYGSLLQAYALKKTIENMGYECGFMDIKKGVQLGCHAQAKNTLQNGIVHWRLQKLKNQGIKAFLGYFHRKIYRRKFKSVFFNLLGLPKNIDPDGFFDIVIIGSDEVFNFAQKTWWGYSEQLFGGGINARKIFTYAASFGWTRMEDILSNGLTEQITKALNNISCFSVRDENSEKIIKRLTGKTACLNTDPTLIYDFHKEISDKCILKNYIVLYSYAGRTDSKNEIKVIRKFAKTHQKKLLSVGYYHFWCDKNIIPDPFDVLNYFIHADYIITDTFHGTVFSIKFHKRFCTIIRDTNEEKLSHLLKHFNLSNRIATSVDQIPEILQSPIDFIETEDMILKEKENALNYLKTCLKSMKNQSDQTPQNNAESYLSLIKGL